MKNVWRDITSYSQDEKERIPTSFELRSQNLRIVITNSHIYYKGEWIMHCFQLGIKDLQLNMETEESAKNKAIHVVMNQALELFLESRELYKKEFNT